jgi:enoyl-CoA hydratase/carnithine racemase
MPNIRFDVVESGVGLITINRPEKRNALNDETVLSLIEVLESDDVADLGAVVLVGQGTTFCAGVDLSEIGTAKSRSAKPQGSRLFAAFRECGPVIIGAVQRHALGLGCGVAMACDLVVAADDAQFGYPAVAHGLVNGVTLVGLKEVVGARKAMELLVTGRRVLADEALAIGMVNEVVPGTELRTRAMEIARTVAGHRTLAVQTTKQFFYEASDLSYAAATRAGERVVQLVRKANDPELRVATAPYGQVSAQ